MAYAKGTKVKQIVKPIEGVVAGFQVDPETGALQVLVEYELEGTGGAVTARYFNESDLEVV